MVKCWVCGIGGELLFRGLLGRWKDVEQKVVLVMLGLKGIA